MAKYFEDEYTELKRELIDEVKSEIIAFLNSNGGTIYVGVEDDGSIIGIKDDSSKDKIDLKLILHTQLWVKIKVDALSEERTASIKHLLF